MAAHLGRIAFLWCLAIPAYAIDRAAAQSPIPVPISRFRGDDPSVVSIVGDVRTVPDSGSVPKSPRRATRLAIGATIVPVAAGVLLAGSPTSGYMRALGSLMIVGGVLVGPSTGHFYAGRLGFLPYRLGATAAAVGLLAALEEPAVGNLAPVLVLIPIPVFVILDWTTADAAARGWNRRHGLSVAAYPWGAAGGAGFRVAFRASL
jgi:hypothetical protein